jgi:serine protease Do
VVNIRGEKTLRPEEAINPADANKRVNGMGTGVVVDPRGYILTNYHVVEGVEALKATLDGGRSFSARVVSHDTANDLALLKIDGCGKLPVIPVGTSTDLMLGETVIVVGNPFGYEHTVTRGIISSLHRTVQVTATQNYEDLIQTDASINPGNSGGPLLNIEGDVIGLAVAVRVGAQGIGFAIPIDKAMAAAARLVAKAEGNNAWHGLEGDDDLAEGCMRVKSVAEGSPAAQVGLKPGDVIVAADGENVHRSLDFERTVLGRKPGEEIGLVVERGTEQLDVRLVLARMPRAEQEADAVWSVLGLKLQPVGPESVKHARTTTRYRGGLFVREVRPGSPAAKEGIRRGDILLGMHIWETIALDNVHYVLEREDLATFDPVKFYILRGSETLYGHIEAMGK